MYFLDDVFVVDCGVDYWFIDLVVWVEFYGGDYFGVWSYGFFEFLFGMCGEK